MEKASENNFFSRDRNNLMLVSVFAVLVVLPVLFYGVPYGSADMPHHYQCALTYLEAIKSGDFYPSWTLDRNLGYGALELRLYPPLSHYVLALFAAIFKNWHLASWASYTFWWILGGIGIYLLAREFVKPSAALFAAALFSVMPYRLSQLYFTFLYSELCAIAILPFCFLFLTRLLKKTDKIDEFETSKNKKVFLNDIFGFAISYAALILTHLPMTLIGTLCLGIYFAAQVKWNLKYLRVAIFKSVCGLTLGLAATSFFWVKVLQERFLLAKNEIYSNLTVNYQFNFLFTFIQSYDDLSIEVYKTRTEIYDGILFLTLLIILPVALLGLFSEKTFEKHWHRGIWWSLAIAVFLTTVFSRPIWDVFPLLAEVQFPWRFLGIVSIFAPIVAAGGFANLINWFRIEKRRPFALIILGVILIGSFFSINQSIRGAVYKDSGELDDYIKNASQAEGLTFWWSIWTRKEIFNTKVEVSAENREVQIQKWTAAERQFRISPGAADKARIAVFYHPNWRAAVNGSQIETKPDENGALLLPLSTAESTADLSFQETAEVVIAQYISIFIWLLFALLALRIARANLFSESARNLGDNSEVKIQRVIQKIYLFSKSKYAPLLLIGLAVVSLFPMIFVGIYKGGDLPQHIQFADTFQKAIAAGEFYPSWAAPENLGYGSVGTRFYPPLTTFIFGLTHLLLGNWHTSTWITLLFFNLIGALGVYLWAKEFIPSSKAIWAGAAFILMPYHLHEIYSASMYAEFAGSCIITFSFLYVTRICRNGTVSDVLGLAVSYALLILTHLPSTVFGSIMLCLYAVVLLIQTKNKRAFIKLSLSVLFGLAASSMYWMKVVTEMSWLRNTKTWHDTHFDYNYNFLFDLFNLDNFELLYFSAIALSLVILVSGAVFGLYFNKSNKIRNELLAVIIVFFFSIFMTSVLSKPLWDVMPFLQEVQFPWRLLTIASISGSILLAAGIGAIWNLFVYSPNWKKTIQGYVTGGFLFLTVVWFIGGGIFLSNYLSSDEFDIWATEVSTSMGFEWFWTTNAQETVFSIKEKVVAGERETLVSSWNSNERTFSIQAGTPTNIRIATLFYPHWRAEVNQRAAAIDASSDGAILIPISEEQSNIRLWFEEPLRVKISLYISILIWLAFGLIFLCGKIQNFYCRQPDRVNCKR